MGDDGDSLFFSKLDEFIRDWAKGISWRDDLMTATMSSLPTSFVADHPYPVFVKIDGGFRLLGRLRAKPLALPVWLGDEPPMLAVSRDIDGSDEVLITSDVPHPDWPAIYLTLMDPKPESVKDAIGAAGICLLANPVDEDDLFDLARFQPA